MLRVPLEHKVSEPTFVRNLSGAAVFVTLHVSEWRNNTSPSVVSQNLLDSGNGAAVIHNEYVRHADKVMVFYPFHKVAEERRSHDFDTRYDTCCVLLLDVTDAVINADYNGQRYQKQ
jgi:hypothetical protein